MGAFDDITGQYGKAVGNNNNAFEDITTEYGYDVGNAPKPTFWDSVKNNAEYVANGVKNNIEWIDKTGKEINDNVGNTLTNWKDDVLNKSNNLGNEYSKSAANAIEANGDNFSAFDDNGDFVNEYATPGLGKARVEAYNAGVGKPAGYLAITPYVPPQVRIAAGVLAAPTIASDTVDMYNANEAAENEGTAPDGILGNKYVATAKNVIVDPIANPVERLIDNPGEFAKNIAMNPTNLWDDVFLPVGMIHGVTPKKVSGAIGERVGRVSEHIKEKASNAFEDIGERFKREEPNMQEGVLYNAFEDVPVPEEPINAVEPREYSEGGLNGQAFEGETGNIQADIYNRYRQNGLSDVEAAGMTGNIGAESSFSTTVTSGDGYGSRGLVQFTGDRLNGENGLLKFAERKGLDPWDWRTQVDFSVWELHNTESAALEAMRARPDATPAEMARIIREKYERPDPAVAHDEVRAEIAENTFKGNYGKYENGPRDVSFKDETLNPNHRTYEEPFKDEFIEREMSKTEEPHTDLNSFVENTDKKPVKNEDLGINYQGESETARTGEINEFQPKDRINTDLVEGEKHRIQEKAVENDVNSQFRYEEDAPNVSLRNAIDELPQKARETIVNELKDVVKHDASETRFTELENKVHSNTEILQDLNRATKPDIPKSELDAVKVKLSEKLDVPVETLSHEHMERIRTERAAELIADTQELKTLQAEPAEGGVSKYAQQPSQLLEHATHEQVHEAFVKAFDGNETMAKRYLESKGVRPTEPLQYSVRGKDTPHTGVDEVERLGRNVTRKEILDAVNHLFNQRVKSGRLGKEGVGGWYNTKTDVIRSGNYGDLRVIMHELGHYVDNYFKFSNEPRFNNEFNRVIQDRFGKAYDKLGMEGVRGEGYAEFFHDYVSDRAKAKREFPEFYKHFTEKIEKEPELNGITNKLSKLVHEWHRQGGAERVKGSISFESKGKVSQAVDAVKRGETRDVIKKAMSDVYTKLVDELNPLKDLVEQVERETGEKISFDDNPYMQAWLARGWAGKAEALIEHGAPEYKIPAFKDIIKDIGKNEHKEFSAYLVALHDLDLHKNKQKATFEYTEDAAVLGRHAGNERFQKAAKEIYKYQDYLLAMLVKEGLLTAKAYHTMRKMYPHYIPFFRDMSDVGMQSFLSGGKGFIDVSSPVKRLKGSTRDIIDPLESIIKNTFQFYNAVERNHVGRTFAKLADKKGVGQIVERVKGDKAKTDNTFNVWENGEKVTYETTPELIQTMRMLDKEQSSMIMKILSYPANWLRAGATLSPEFIMRNPVRDMIGAAIYSKHGFIPIVDTFKGLSLYLKKGQAYWEYKKSGAAHAAMVSLDRDYLGGQLRDIMKRESKFTKLIKNPIEALRAMSEATEMATRLAEYDNARKGYTGVGNRLFGKERKPLSAREAALESRDITLDFSRRGTNTKKANQVIAFFNATIQGADKMARAFKEDPRGMTVKTMLYITLPSVLLWYMNKDDERYQELPQWEKDTFWIIPGKENMYKIPKPFEAGILFGTAFERMLQYMDDKKNDRKGVGFKGFGERVFDSFAPSFMPTAMIPIVEATTNYSLFRQRNIIPQSQENLPARLQYGANSSEVAKFVGDKINVSPYIVDNTIRGYGGGLAGLGLSAIDAASGAKENNTAKKWYEAPGLRGFTAAPYQSSNSVQRVYDDYKEQEKLHNAFKLTGQRPEGYDAKEFARLKNASDSLKNLNKASKAIINNERMSGEQKREQLDKINMRKANIARSVYGLGKVK
jgi:lytic transglycosylase, catalytic|nr:MAG TPA: Type I restriction enzyme Methylase [Caudoviricetes sp.]